MVPKPKGPMLTPKPFAIIRNRHTFAPPKPPRCVQEWRLTKNKKTMTESEKERWQLIGVIATAVGTAIASYFAGKK